ncbi:hypothetical protein KC318_g9487 [Hortaea werneckii]|nr:hypothetical protein KC334_g13781 [Hortaea werneckii]KAI7007414.1 hypothetical protein KC355_g7349 [Hortaea werneckii]KAI7661413.1 hypothetical protein KC318_g9487 [Hortaea werneckii]
MSTRTRLTYSVTLNSSGEKIGIDITDPSSISADNLALATWGSAEVLANTLHKHHIDLGNGMDNEGVTGVIELGAGTGIAGLAAACVWKTNAILTDLPLIVPALEANVTLNEDRLKTHGGNAVCGTLDWDEPKDLVISNGSTAGKHQDQNLRARVLLAADTVYSEEHPPLLVKAIEARLELSDKARLILCYPLRFGYLDHIRDLWERLEAAELTCVEEGREKVDESWEEDEEYEWCVWGWKDAQKVKRQNGA